MARRYSNIYQGEELKQAQDRLEQYRKNRQTKRRTGGTPGEKQAKFDVSILPFGGSGDVRALVSVTAKGKTNLASKLATRVSSEDKLINASEKLKGFRAARVHYFSPDGDTRQYVQSKQTGLYYLKYAGETYSSPFGCTAKTEEFAPAARTVKATVMAFEPSKSYRRAWVENERWSI